MEGERKGEKHQCAVASGTPPTEDLAHNSGMCPDWELNWLPSGSQPTLNPLSYTSQGNNLFLYCSILGLTKTLVIFKKNLFLSSGFIFSVDAEVSFHGRTRSQQENRNTFSQDMSPAELFTFVSKAFALLILSSVYEQDTILSYFSMQL